MVLLRIMALDRAIRNQGVVYVYDDEESNFISYLACITKIIVKSAIWDKLNNVITKK